MNNTYAALSTLGYPQSWRSAILYFCHDWFSHQVAMLREGERKEHLRYSSLQYLITRYMDANDIEFCFIIALIKSDPDIGMSTSVITENIEKFDTNELLIVQKEFSDLDYVQTQINRQLLIRLIHESDGHLDLEQLIKIANADQVTQRQIVEKCDSTVDVRVLNLLSTSGKTKKVRNIALHRLNHRDM